MKRIAIIVLLISIFLSGTSYGYVVVLIYHKVGNPKSPSTNVSINRFRKQMKYLKVHHYSVIPLKRLIRLLRHKQSLPQKAVVITFDDGYKSVFNNAFPIIKKYGYPATVFLPTEAIEKHYPAYMTLREIKEMMKYHIDFQSHSYAHAHMAYLKKGETIQEYKAWITQDLKKSISFFKRYLGYKPIAFAFPYGDYNRILIRIAKKLGFECLLTQDIGSVGRYTPLTMIPREPILGKYWATMRHFRWVLSLEPLSLKRRYPPVGIISGKPEFIGATVRDLRRYKNFMVYTTLNGWQKAKIKDNLVYVKHFTIDTPKDRLGIMAINRTTGREAMRLWMVINQH